MKKLSGKRILVTGISGFIGESLNFALQKAGAQTYGVTRKENKLKNILSASILDFEKLHKFIKQNKIQIIFHLAGESLVERGQTNPFETFKINTEGTLNILESARNNNVESIVIASTSHVYGRNKVPYYEGYMPRPSRPYETSKACTDLIAQSYAESFNLPVLIPRFVNIYGPGDKNFTRLIPKTIRAVLSQKKPQMWGGHALREYLFIDDAVRAYMLLASINASKVGKNRVFNFGSGDILSVKDLIEKINFHANSDKGIKKINDKRELEIPAQYVSSKKAKKLLKWEAKTSLDKGLPVTIAWYKKFLYNE